MKLENEKLLKGQTVFFPKPTAHGETLKAGEVVDLNEPTKSAKLRFVFSTKTGVQKSDWFPVAKLRRSLPEKVTTP